MPLDAVPALPSGYRENDLPEVASAVAHKASDSVALSAGVVLGVPAADLIEEIALLPLQSALGESSALLAEPAAWVVALAAQSAQQVRAAATVPEKCSAEELAVAAAYILENSARVAPLGAYDFWNRYVSPQARVIRSELSWEVPS